MPEILREKLVPDGVEALRELLMERSKESGGHFQMLMFNVRERQFVSK